MILSPHTATLSTREDERIVENLARYKDGRPLLNLIDPEDCY